MTTKINETAAAQAAVELTSSQEINDLLYRIQKQGDGGDVLVAAGQLERLLDERERLREALAGAMPLLNSFAVAGEIPGGALDGRHEAGRVADLARAALEGGVA